MATFDILLKGGTVVFPDRVTNADIAVTGERITAIGRIPPSVARIVLDCTDRIITPGLIDPHTHIHWPFLDDITRDDFETGSRAALFGGTTTIIDFAVQRSDGALAAIEQRLLEMEGHLWCDAGLTVAITHPEHHVEREWTEIARQVLAFKAYMIYKHRGIMLTDDALWRTMLIAQNTGKLLTIHAESHDLHQLFLAEVRNSFPPNEARSWAMAKPAIIEEEAMQRAMVLARHIGIPVYFRHVSSAQGLGVAAKAQEEGALIYVETCPQYLLLDESLYQRSNGSLWIASPPLRKEEDRDALWAGVYKGVVTTVGSDHCAFDQTQKLGKSFDSVPNGIPGVETRGPAIWGEARQRGWQSSQHLQRLVSVLSTEAAKAFGLYPRKGVIIPNADADLVVWAQEPLRLKATSLHMPVDWSPYDEHMGFGHAEHVFLRGAGIIRDGIWVGTTPRGKILRTP